jgi:uroporphyrinogen decarboxylase
MFGYDGTPRYGFASCGGWEFGGEIRMPRGQWEQAPFDSRFPATTPEEVEALKIPEVETAGSYSIAIQFAKIQKQSGTPITIKGFVPFTSAENICDVNNLCRWMLKKPTVVHQLLRKCMEFHKKVIDYFINHFPGLPMLVFMGEPTTANQVISPRQFEEFALSYINEAHQYCFARGINHIMNHICGEQNLNLDLWTKIPHGDPGILSFGHEVYLTKAIEIFGDQHVIAGNIEPRVIQEGTWQKVYEICWIAIEKAKYAPSGYIFTAGCEVPLNAIPYNLYAMKKAVMDFGFYDN